MAMDREHRVIHSYGRRAARLTPAQSRAYYHPTPHQRKYRISAPRHIESLCAHNPYSLIVEIGSGMGEATIANARQHAHYTYLAIEVYRAGIAKLLWAIDRYSLDNLFVYEGDVAPLLHGILPPASLLGLHIFFPDPWPKTRHHKRRLLNACTCRQLRALLLPRGYCAIATDHGDYAAQIAAACKSAGMTPMHLIGAAYYRAWRAETAYEQKARRSSSPIYEMLFYNECANPARSDTVIKNIHAPPKI